VTRPVHVVVVAYHGARELGEALASVGAGRPVTVVDNSQNEDVGEVCAQRGARYVQTIRNLGFAAGANVALRELLDGDPCDVLLLNPDSTLPEGAVDRLAETLAADRGVGAVAPAALVRRDGSSQRVLWPFPSPGQAWLEALGLGRLSRSPRFAVGAVLLLRWEALQEVGLLDERFFLYAEETDWQRRAQARGWRTTVSESVTATHAGGSASDDPSQRERLFYAAQEIYIRKWYGSGGWLSYRLAAIVGAAVRTVVLRRSRRSGAARRLLIYLRGPCRVAAAGS